MAEPFPDTRGAEFVDWASSVLYINQPSDLPYPRKGFWRSWALKIIEHPLYESVELPNPYSFNNWKKWGDWSNLTLNQ